MPQATRHKPIVSVIFVSYNTRKLTAKAIDLVNKSQGFDQGEVDIIVVDNNSSDDTVSYLKKNHQEVTLLENKTNRGFGVGNNQGLKVAKGKYILLLNTDAFVQSDTLKKLTEILEKNQDIVSVGPQLKNPDGSLQSSLGYFPNFARVVAWMLWLDKLPIIKNLFPNPYHVFDPQKHETDQYPDWLMGACVMFRKQELEGIRGFDEKIFMYAEEVELYLKLAKKYGKKVFFTTGTSVIHLKSASSKQAKAQQLILELKGIEYIYKKYSPHLLILAKAVIMTGVVLRILVFSLLPNRREAVKEYIKYLE